MKDKHNECKVCGSDLNECQWPELINDGFCSYSCQDEYYILLEDRYYKFDRYDYNTGEKY
jgi:hypothetical protein